MLTTYEETGGVYLGTHRGYRHNYYKKWILTDSSVMRSIVIKIYDNGLVDVLIKENKDQGDGVSLCVNPDEETFETLMKILKFYD